MARNKNAGKHPSYDKRGMTDEAIQKKRIADKKINERPEQVKKRMEANEARRKAKQKGKDIEGKDFDHAVGGFVKTSTNRGRKEKSRIKK